MRLLYVASTREAGYVDDLRRYPEFHKRLSSNLDHLRGTIEGFVIALDSPSHYLVRDLELRMRWLRDHLAKPKVDCHLEFRVAYELGRDFDRFCDETWRGEYKSIKDAVRSVVASKCPQVLDGAKTLDRPQALRLRYKLQDDVLDSQFGAARPYGAFYDYRQETSIYYFLIDLLLLPHHVEANDRA